MLREFRYARWAWAVLAGPVLLAGMAVLAAPVLCVSALDAQGSRFRESSGECSSAEWSRVEESSARQSPAGQTGVGSTAVQQEESASEQFQLEQFEIESGSDGEQMQLPAKLIASWIGDGARQRGADVEAPRVGDLSGEATRLDELRSMDWANSLRVRVVRALDDAPTLIGEDAGGLLGEYVVGEQGQLMFRPRFTFQPGLIYVVYLRSFVGNREQEAGDDSGRAEAGTESAAFKLVGWGQIALPATGPPQLVRISPRLECLPENLLKFYLHFDRPMRKGVALEHVRLVGPEGVIDRPFLALEQELWSRDGTRLTLILDPGRVKQGLRPREELGPILQSGLSYVLEVDAGWDDALGRKLADGVAIEFKATAADEVQPQPGRWQWVLPRAGSQQELLVQLDEPLDDAILRRALGVWFEGNEVNGEVRVDAGQQRWRFVPDENWAPGEYELRFPDSLEDLAGNSVGRLFEVDQFKRAESPEPKIRRLNFKIR